MKLSRPMMRPPLTSSSQFPPRMTDMVFSIDSLSTQESTLRSPLKSCCSMRRLKNSNTNLTPSPLRNSPPLLRRSTRERSNLSSNLPPFLKPMMSQSRWSSAKISEQSSLIPSRKFWLNSMPLGAATASTSSPTTKRLPEDWPTTLTSSWLRSIQPKTKSQELTFKVSPLLSSGARTSPLSLLSSLEKETLTELLTGLRSTPNTSGSSLLLIVKKLLRPMQNCDHHYSHGSYVTHQHYIYNSNQMHRGKLELLEWINKLMQTEYTSVEALSDGVAYSQMIDAIHPGSINIFKLNLGTRYPEDNYRNVKLIEDALKKLKITQPLSFEKISKGKFHDNIVLLQWLHGYANRNGLQNLQTYRPYEKRLQILEKQNKPINQMNLHLKPNQAYYEEQDWQAGVEAEEEVNIDGEIDPEIVQNRLERVDEFVRTLQSDLKEKMELNWRMMHLVDKTIEERNCLYSLLSHIDKIVSENPESPLKNKLLEILHEKPAEYE